jgi:hypothetical protein
MARGQIFDLFDELTNSGNIQHERIGALEKATKRNVIWYHANMGHPLGGMIPPDADMVENIVSSLDLTPYEGIDLYLNTPGGLPEVAARMLRSVRTRTKSFRVVVPSQAMSAGTLLAFGADEILMGPASALGPVDPQMVRMTPGGPTVSRPAKQYIEAYEDLAARAQHAIMGGLPPHPWLQQLKEQDASFIMECKKARDATKNLGAQFLLDGMLKGKQMADAQGVVELFIKHGDEGTHGMPIWANKAREMGLTVRELDGNSDDWRAIRELYVRYEQYVGAKGLAKTIGCRAGGLDMNAQPMSPPPGR